MSNDLNGGNLHKCDVGVIEMLRETHSKVHATHSSIEKVVTLLDEKIDYLIETIVKSSNQDKVPISVLRWIVIFMIVFVFALVFGIEQSKTLLGASKNIIGIP